MESTKVPVSRDDLFLDTEEVGSSSLLEPTIPTPSPESTSAPLCVNSASPSGPILGPSNSPAPLTGEPREHAPGSSAGDGCQQLIITPDDPRAAELKTVTGWVSRDGFFYGKDERTARYAGSTHSRCDCGTVTSKGILRCGACQRKRDDERYMGRERMEWDGEQMIYSELLDEYYSEPGAAIEAACDYEFEDGSVINVEGLSEQHIAEVLRLVLCEPNKPRLIDADYFADELPADGDDEIPPELEAAAKAFNLIAQRTILSWTPGKYALRMPIVAAQAGGAA